MAGEQSASSVGYEKIYDMGTGLIIAKVQIDKLREQDINARIMKKEMQDQLTANIKNRGQLESLPLLAEKAHQERTGRRHERDYRHHRREWSVP